MSSRLDKKQNLGKFWQIHPRHEFLRLSCDQTTNQGTATSNFIYQRHSTKYISNNLEESKMFETITVSLIHKIYIIFYIHSISTQSQQQHHLFPTSSFNYLIHFTSHFRKNHMYHFHFIVVILPTLQYHIMLYCFVHSHVTYTWHLAHFAAGPSAISCIHIHTLCPSLEEKITTQASITSLYIQWDLFLSKLSQSIFSFHLSLPLAQSHTFHCSVFLTFPLS